MFDPNGDTNQLEDLILAHISAMAGMNAGEEEYTAAAQQLKVLMEARKINQETEKIDEETTKIAGETDKLEKECARLLAETAKITRETEIMDGLAAKTAAETIKLESEALKLDVERSKIQFEIDHPWRPSADQVLAAGTTVLTVAAILAFEMRGVITSKSFGWIPKVKI